jgi:hypothetical protein
VGERAGRGESVRRRVSDRKWRRRAYDVSWRLEKCGRPRFPRSLPRSKVRLPETYRLTLKTNAPSLRAEDGPPWHNPSREARRARHDPAFEPKRDGAPGGRRPRAYWALVRAAELSQTFCSLRPPHPTKGAGVFLWPMIDNGT